MHLLVVLVLRITITITVLYYVGITIYYTYIRCILNKVLILYNNSYDVDYYVVKYIIYNYNSYRDVM